jgi:hypothetical protein
VDVRLHEVGRFVSGLKKRQFADSSWVKRIEDYVVKRQNDDGGYAFAQGLDSNAQDTYYGLTILDLLKVPFPRVKKTIKWLHDFVPDSHYSHYYIARGLKICGEKPHRSLKDLLLSLQSSKGEFGTVDVYIEVASEFQFISIITELANIVGVEINREKTTSWLLSYQNRDGGFGAHRHSNLNSTYHAVASLFNLGYAVKFLKETLKYVRSCEKPSGGFTVVPNSSIPYMEHVHYGVSTLGLLNENLRYLEKTAEFVLRCQNSNGGFARSDLGISTFEDTFYAVSVLQMVNRYKIIESRGFCNHHFYKILIAASKPGSSDGHGIALVNKSIVEKLIQDLHKKSLHIDDLNRLVATENKCPACIHLSEFAKMYVEKVVELLSTANEEFLKLLKESNGFCWLCASLE